MLGIDVARSASARADYTAMIAVAWNLRTGIRRILDIRREKGLEFDEQIELICDLTMRHNVAVCMIEDNGMQQWLIDALRRRPETWDRVYGHRTGSNKADLQEGIPRLALAFRAGSWIIPSGDAVSRQMARIFQAELGAFIYLNGRYAGVGEHDDTVVAAWLVERAIARGDRSLERATGRDRLCRGHRYRASPHRQGLLSPPGRRRGRPCKTAR